MAGRQERTITGLPPSDMELVIHCFAPGDGPAADEAYQQLRRVWAACRERMGMTERIAGLPVPAVLPETRDELPADEGDRSGGKPSVGTAGRATPGI